MGTSTVNRERLEEAVLRSMEQASTNVMQWGVDDCALWVANTIYNALGYDPGARWRTGYCDQQGALDSIGKLGLGYVLRSASKKHGWKRIAPDSAVCGDIGIGMFGGVASVMICRSRGWFLIRNENGFTAISDSAVRIAWSVV